MPNKEIDEMMKRLGWTGVSFGIEGKSPLNELSESLEKSFTAIRASSIYVDPYMSKGLARVPYDDVDSAIVALDKNINTVDNKVRILDRGIKTNVSLMEHNKRLMEKTNTILATMQADARRSGAYNRFKTEENEMEMTGTSLKGYVERKIQEELRSRGLESGKGGMAFAGGAGGGGGIGPGDIILAHGIGRGAGAILRGTGAIARGVGSAVASPGAALLGAAAAWWLASTTAVNPKEDSQILKEIIPGYDQFIENAQKGKDVNMNFPAVQAPPIGSKKIYDEVAGPNPIRPKIIYQEEPGPDAPITDEDRKRILQMVNPDPALVKKVFSIYDEIQKKAEEARRISYSVFVSPWGKRGVFADDDVNYETMVPPPMTNIPRDAQWLPPLPGEDVNYETMVPPPMTNIPPGARWLPQLPGEAGGQGPSTRGQMGKFRRFHSSQMGSIPGSYPGRSDRFHVAYLGGDYSSLFDSPSGAIPGELEGFIQRYGDRKFNENLARNESSKTVLEDFIKEYGLYDVRAREYVISTQKTRVSSIEDLILTSESVLSLESKSKITLKAPEIEILGKVTYGEYSQGIVGGSYLSGGTGYDTGSSAPLVPATTNQPGGTLYNPIVKAPGTMGSSPGTGQGVSAGSMQQRAYNYLRSKGLSDIQAKAVVANIQRESGFSTLGVHNDSGGPSAGFFQHHNERFYALKRAVPDFDNPESLERQIDFAMSEPEFKKFLSGSYSTVEQASLAFIQDFEKPRDPSAAQRTNLSYLSGYGDMNQAYLNPPGAGQSGYGPTGRNILDPKQVPPDGGSPGSRAFGGGRAGKLHTGQDVPVSVGETVKATGKGRVVRADNSDSGGYGWVVDVEYEDGTVHRYAHLGTDRGGRKSAIPDGIKVGTEVNPGDTIGYGGYSGNASPSFPHVHYEVIKGDYYHANNGRPPGRARTLKELQAGRLDPVNGYWKAISEKEDAETVDVGGVPMSKKGHDRIEDWLSKNEDLGPVNKIPPIKPNTFMEDNAPKKAEPPVVVNNTNVVAQPPPPPKNTHDGVRMSASDLVHYASSVLT